MNDSVRLKGDFFQKSSSGKPGPAQLPKGGSVMTQHLIELKGNIKALIEFWQGNHVLKSGVIVSAYYREVVAKSNRIGALLLDTSGDPSDYIIGAKFTDNDDMNPKHIITYNVSLAALEESVRRLDVCARILTRDFSGEINRETLKAINAGQRSLDISELAKSNFAKVIVDAFYVERFDLDQSAEEIEQAGIVSVYDIGENTQELLQRLGLDVANRNFLGKTTFYATEAQFNLLKSKAPYLISMSVSDLADYELPDEAQPIASRPITIPQPGIEPTVGVIDTVFDGDVYFSDWVEDHDLVAADIPGVNSPHGTEVTSIIVDGPSFNPSLDDGCGRFKVRHFGVTRGGVTSSFTILKAIKEIVSTNTDIKVWNLSLGSPREVNRNFISPEAAVLDELENQYDVIFVIAGTNKGIQKPAPEIIGAPADSVNSLVVNAVDSTGKIVDYARRGPVLSFFSKPDVSYFGGDNRHPLRACTALGEEPVMGTSFAAPWITRKMAFLINVMGFSREVAKAYIIDSAIGWKRDDQDSRFLGFGVVPTDIKQVLQSQNDEIRFVLTGVSASYDTYNYNIPVPVTEDKFPYLAKATLCYFPGCSRNQGVDYTNTELDLHFGRLNSDSLKSINDNKQGDKGHYDLDEKNVRRNFRKWDNIKHIGEELKPNARARKKYDQPLWGISLKTKQRMSNVPRERIPFGIVVTLKNIFGDNEIEEFKQNCRLRGWLVNDINIENQIQVNTEAETDIHWD